MFTLRKSTALGLGALALSVVALSGQAWAAASTLTSAGAVTFATQAVAGASGTVTIPAVTAVKYTTATSSATSVASGSITIVFTLPTGVTPSGAVTGAVTDGGGVNCTPNAALAGVVSGSTITFTVPTLAAGTANTCSVQLNAFTINGATALQTATTSTATAGFLVTGQLTATSGGATFVVDAAALKTALASSTNGLLVTSVAGAAQTIDTGPTAQNGGVAAPGKVFGAGGVDSLAESVATPGLGTVLSNTCAACVAANGTTAFSFGTGVLASVVITGNMSGIASMWLDPAGAACQTTSAKESAVSGIIGGTLTTGSATFSSVPLSAVAANICEYATGANVIGANASGVNAATTISGTTVAGAVALAATTYSTGTPYYVTYGGNNSSYPSYLRIVNNSGLAIQVYADVQSDNGSVGSAVVETSLAPFTNDLVADSTIMTNAGVTATSQGRASFILFSAPANGVAENGAAAGFGAGAVGISHLMVNPNGTVVQMGGNSSP
jgi:hypothetical protein